MLKRSLLPLVTLLSIHPVGLVLLRYVLLIWSAINLSTIMQRMQPFLFRCVVVNARYQVSSSVGTGWDLVDDYERRKDEVRALFAQCDRGQSGSITVPECKSLLCDIAARDGVSEVGEGAYIPTMLFEPFH